MDSSGGWSKKEVSGGWGGRGMTKKVDALNTRNGEKLLSSKWGFGFCFVGEGTNGGKGQSCV